jgi:3-deoxy-manno-octulosonate cytidylyltransferase (CMP-KDO synthetase)
MIVAIIPARFHSTRFKGKPLTDIAGKPMIEWTYRHAKKARILERVIVATDDRRIFDVVRGFGGEVCLTSPKH